MVNYLNVLCESTRKAFDMTAGHQGCLKRPINLLFTEST